MTSRSSTRSADHRAAGGGDGGRPGKRAGDRPGAGARGSARVGSCDERRPGRRPRDLPGGDRDGRGAARRRRPSRPQPSPRCPVRGAPGPTSSSPGPSFRACIGASHTGAASTGGSSRPSPPTTARPPTRRWPPTSGRRSPTPFATSSSRPSSRPPRRRRRDHVTRPADVRVSPGLVASAAGHRGDRCPRAGRFRASGRRRPGAGRPVPVAATGSAWSSRRSIRAACRASVPCSRRTSTRITSISPLGRHRQRLPGRRVRRPGAARADGDLRRDPGRPRDRRPDRVAGPGGRRSRDGGPGSARRQHRGRLLPRRRRALEGQGSLATSSSSRA